MLSPVPDIVDLHSDTHFNSRSHGIFIQSLATPRHISDREHDRAARSVFRDRATALSRRGRCRDLRDLRPCERGRDCQSSSFY